MHHHFSLTKNYSGLHNSDILQFFQMISPDHLHSLSDSDETGSSSRISFSSEFLDESNFITICPSPSEARDPRPGVDFEFLSGNRTGMIAADELFSEGKLLPFWQIHQGEQLSTISVKSDGADKELVGSEPEKKGQESRMTWFLDDDPSPRPPKCTVLWKELLKLKKQRPPSTLTTSNSNSSSSSSSSSSRASATEDRGELGRNSEKCSKKLKKGTRSVSIRIRPVLNVPICTQARNSATAAALPPLFSFRKVR